MDTTVAHSFAIEHAHRKARRLLCWSLAILAVGLWHLVYFHAPAIFPYRFDRPVIVNRGFAYSVTLIGFGMFCFAAPTYLRARRTALAPMR